MAYNIRIIENLCTRAMTRHHIKAIFSIEGGSKTLYYFGGKTYKQGIEEIGRLIACEESHVYREYIKGKKKSALHKAIANEIERPDDPKKAVGQEYIKRILNGEETPILMNAGQQAAAVKTLLSLPQLPAAVIGENTAGLLCLNDCILKITADNVEVLPHDPKPFFISYLDINYKMPLSQYSANMVKYLGYMLDWANKNEQVKELIGQMIGAIIQQDSGSGYVFIIVNPQGGNGKSTFGNSIVAFVGINNISTISLQEMAKDSHQAAALVGKYINFVDDMSGDFVGDISILKSCVTGGFRNVNPKHVKPYSAQLTATNIICCNKIPRIGDTTGGLNDRLCIVPFLARFRNTADDVKDRDMNIFFAQPETRRAMLEIAINGLQETMKHGYTIPDIVKIATQEYLTENILEIDSVLAFIEASEESSNVGMAMWSELDVAQTYGIYSRWCEANGRRAKASNVFTKDFLAHRKQYYEVKTYRRNVEVWCDIQRKKILIKRRGKEFIAHTTVPLPDDTDTPFDPPQPPQQLKIAESIAI